MACSIDPSPSSFSGSEKCLNLLAFAFDRQVGSKESIRKVSPNGRGASSAAQADLEH
jgi:hypothetical protein